MRRLQIAQLAVLVLLTCIITATALIVTRGRAAALGYALVLLVGAGGAGAWLVLDRAGRRVVGALVEATDEQRALRRVASSVMRGDELERTLAIVAREAGLLSGAAVTEVVGTRTGAPPVALWTDETMRAGAGPRVLGTLAAMRRRADDGERPRVRTLRDADGATDRELAAAGLVSAAAVPVIAGGSLWGALGAAFRATDVPHDTLDLLERFAEQAALVDRSGPAAHSRLSAQASTDHLTGLANHRAFHERLTAEVAAAGRARPPRSLVLLDLDGFRRVNEGLGHQVGDRALVRGRAPAGRRRRAEGDLVARIGGEEFAWLMPGASRRWGPSPRPSAPGVWWGGDRFDAGRRDDYLGGRLRPLAGR